jgi:UPF0716 protein FxsA
VKLLFRLLTLFMTVPIAELFFLIQAEKLFDRWTGGYGLLLTGALIIATAVAGSYLAKREGLSAWNRLQSQISGGGLPGDELLDAVIILVAGAFLITPGVLTDLVGFIGLVPLTRGGVRRLVKRRLKNAMREGRVQTSFSTFGGGPFGGAAGSGEATTASPDESTGDASTPSGEPTVSGAASARGPSPQSPSSAPDTPPPDEHDATPSERPPAERPPSRTGDGSPSRPRRSISSDEDRERDA